MQEKAVRGLTLNMDGSEFVRVRYRAKPPRFVRIALSTVRMALRDLMEKLNPLPENTTYMRNEIDDILDYINYGHSDYRD